MGHVSAKGSYPNFWTVATFGAAGATAGSCITLIACKLARIIKEQFLTANITSPQVPLS